MELPHAVALLTKRRKEMQKQMEHAIACEVAQKKSKHTDSMAIHQLLKQVELELKLIESL